MCAYEHPIPAHTFYVFHSLHYAVSSRVNSQQPLHKAHFSIPKNQLSFVCVYKEVSQRKYTEHAL